MKILANPKVTRWFQFTFSLENVASKVRILLSTNYGYFIVQSESHTTKLSLIRQRHMAAIEPESQNEPKHCLPFLKEEIEKSDPRKCKNYEGDHLSFLQTQLKLLLYSNFSSEPGRFD